MRTEADHLAAVEAIAAAAYSDDWLAALRQLARAGGGWSAQLMGVNRYGGLQFNAVADIPAELMGEFESRGGSDPKINPRSKILAMPDYKVCSDRDLASAEELARNPFVQEFLLPNDAADMCLARMKPVDDTQFAIAVSRSRTQGPPEQSDRDCVKALLPHIQNAVRLRSTLDASGSALLVGAMDALKYAAFLVDTSHRVVALTAEAETMVRKATIVTIRNRFLTATQRGADAKLQTALSLACLKPGAAPGTQFSSVLFFDEDGHLNVADIAPLPASHSQLRFGAVAVVAFRQPKEAFPQIRTLQKTFELTEAELDIAQQLLSGRPTGTIAASRGASVETVRSQIKSLFRKVSVASRAEFMSRFVALAPSPQ